MTYCSSAVAYTFLVPYKCFVIFYGMAHICSYYVVDVRYSSVLILKICIFDSCSKILSYSLNIRWKCTLPTIFSLLSNENQCLALLFFYQHAKMLFRQYLKLWLRSCFSTLHRSKCSGCVRIRLFCGNIAVCGILMHTSVRICIITSRICLLIFFHMYYTQSWTL